MSDKKCITKKVMTFLMAVILTLGLTGCREADRVSYNVSKEADNFNVCRRIIVINVRDNSVIYTLEGYFSLAEQSENELAVISEIGAGKYKKDFVYLNEFTTYVCTDLSGANVDRYHYELNILPQMIGTVTITSND